MKKNFILITLIISLLTLCSCSLFQSPQKPTLNEIPQESIKYTSISLGNVIDEGKRGVCLTFTSDYIVKKIEVVGELVDTNGETILSFDENANFGYETKKPEVWIMIDATIVRSIKTAKFTSIKAYTYAEITSTN